MTRFTIGITLEQTTVTEVDIRRGMIPRSRFIEKMILDSIQKARKISYSEESK